MSYALITKFGTGEDDAIYAIILNSSGKVWNGSSMVAIVPGSRADYGVAATPLGTGYYGHEAPSGLPSGDTYTIRPFAPENSSSEPDDEDTELEPTYTFTKAAVTEDDDDEPETIADAIEQNAKGPKQVTGDSGSVTQHSLQDQIAADKYANTKAASRARGSGAVYVKFVPPGTV